MRGHGAKDIGQQDLLRARLDAQINMNEPLVRLSQVIYPNAQLDSCGQCQRRRGAWQRATPTNCGW